MKLLQPLCVVHVGLAARHVLHVARVDEEHFEATRFLEDLEHRIQYTPVDSIAMVVTPTDLSQSASAVQVAGEALE